MGQRLVIKVVQNQKVQAAIHYTWDGYTHAAFRNACEIMRMLKDKDDIIWQLYQFVNCTSSVLMGTYAVHGGIYRADRDEFMRRYSDRLYKGDDITGDGDCGLLAISEQSIHTLEDNAVMDITLNLDDQKADMENAYSYMSGNMYQILYRKDPESLPEPPCDSTFDIPFAKLPAVTCAIDKDGEQDYYDSMTDTCCICVK